LENNFLRLDAYLYELLQNASDEGASDIRVRLNDQGVLTVQHNGAPFTRRPAASRTSDV
jgi:hypothetical protein